jgi:hypothetical protein
MVFHLLNGRLKGLLGDVTDCCMIAVPLVVIEDEGIARLCA